MFKPGTLVRLKPMVGRPRVWTVDGDGYNGVDYWVSKHDIGLTLGYDYNNGIVRVLIGERIVLIPPEVLNIV